MHAHVLPAHGKLRASEARMAYLNVNPHVNLLVMHSFLKRTPNLSDFEMESPPENFLLLMAASSSPVEAAPLHEEAKEMFGLQKAGKRAFVVEGREKKRKLWTQSDQ